MYLKGVEIYGFKSFGERIKIDFEGGITSIVGPNGSENQIFLMQFCGFWGNSLIKI